MTPLEVIAELFVSPAIERAWTSKDGTHRDDDGQAIDPRQLEPHVWALGPFGSWPETLESARAAIAEHPVWHGRRSFRLGRVAIWKDNWGYKLKDKEPADG